MLMQAGQKIGSAVQVFGSGDAMARAEIRCGRPFATSWNSEGSSLETWWGEMERAKIEVVRTLEREYTRTFTNKGEGDASNEADGVVVSTEQVKGKGENRKWCAARRVERRALEPQMPGPRWAPSIPGVGKLVWERRR